MNTKSLLSAFLTAILIDGLVLASALRFGTVQASTDVSGIPKPSIPEFTIETVSFSYDVPPTTTTTIDPYTGKKTVATQPCYHVENKTTQIKIKNQPFTPYQIEIDGKSWTINLFYNSRLKGHFSQDWHYYRLYNGSTDGNLRQNYGSEYTLVPIDDYLPTEDQVDVQIEALIGYEQGIVTVPGAPGAARIITGESSGWSSTQTLTIGESQTPTPSPATMPTPTPYPEPRQTEQEIIVGAAIAAAVIGAGLGLLIYLIKRK